MIRIFVAATIAVAFAATVALCEESSMPSLFPYEIHENTLDNGLLTIVVPMESGGLAAYWSVVRTGSRDEYEPRRTGFAHFFEHMMFRGSENFSAEETNRLVTRMGADTNAFTSTDLTAYYFSISAEDLPRVIEMEADRFQRLRYDESAFEVESGAVHGEYRKTLSSPSFALYEKFVETAFDEHTYGHTVIGYEDDIVLMPELYEYSWEFFERYYRPDNVVLLVVGDVDPDAVFSDVEKHYGGWKPGYVAPDVPEEPEQTEPKRVDVEFSGRTLPMAWVGWKFAAFDPTDVDVAAGVLLGDLAFGETSELYKRLVLDEQRLHSLSVDVDRSRDPRLFTVMATIKSEDDVETMVDEIVATAARFRDEAPTAEQLDTLRRHRRYAFLMNLDTPDKVASRLVRHIALTGGVESVETFYRTLDAVTPEDVQRVAQRFLTDARRTVGVVRGQR